MGPAGEVVVIEDGRTLVLPLVDVVGGDMDVILDNPDDPPEDPVEGVLLMLLIDPIGLDVGVNPDDAGD